MAASPIVETVKTLLKVMAARFLLSLYLRLLQTVGVPTAARVPLHIAIFTMGIIAALWYFQESLLYVPTIRVPGAGAIKTPEDNPAGMRSPRDVSMHHEELRLETSDGVRVHAWWLPAPQDAVATAPTLMFSHENAGNMGLRLLEFQLLHQRLRCNVLAYDYRGYGFSDEAPINEQGLMRDARAAWDWVAAKAARREIDPDRLFLFGRSLGGAVRRPV